VGGKWTTYRKMAEDTLNHAGLIGGFDNRACVTENLHIHGWRSPHAPELPDSLAVYGSDAPKIQELVQTEPALGELIHPRLPYIRASIVWGVRQELARTVEDMLSRRTRALLLDSKAAIESATVVAELMARELNQDAGWVKAQVKEFTGLAQSYVPRAEGEVARES
jgi:glycerol-3-phosphate dehydrogenase